MQRSYTHNFELTDPELSLRRNISRIQRWRQRRTVQLLKTNTSSMYTLNKHLTANAWKDRNRWVQSKYIYCYIDLILWLANKALVSEPVPKIHHYLLSKRKLSVRQVACHVYKEDIATMQEREQMERQPGSNPTSQVFKGRSSAFMETLMKRRCWIWSINGRVDETKSPDRSSTRRKPKGHLIWRSRTESHTRRWDEIGCLGVSQE